MKAKNIETVIKEFIKHANAFNIMKTLALFANEAIIDDTSVGKKFKNKQGVKDYLETYFVDYRTRTKLEELTVRNDNQAKARVDFKGDFGHETGALDVTIDSEGLIISIEAYLD